MKTDDPRLEQGRQELFKRLEKIDERMLTVLKNHLGVELFLNDFLAAAGKRYKRRRFAGKMYIAKGLEPTQIEPPIWAVLEDCNELRNAIAHTLDQQKIQAKMTNLRKVYLFAISPEQRKAAEGLDDTTIAAQAFQLCGGYLAAATEAWKQA